MGIYLTALIVLVSIFSTIPSLHMAYAQEVLFATSADDHERAFFGEGVLQVVITDPDSDDDSTVEELTVDIDADPDSGSQGSTSLTIPETSDSSGKFEFYLVHSDATAVGPGDIDPVNSAGVEGDGNCISDCSPFVTFGASGDLQVDADLYEDVTFDLSAGNTEITIKYEETLAQVALDRSAYGSDSFVYVFIDDQDANLNPSIADEFVVDPSNTPNSDLLVLGGGSIVDVVTFRETGDNTARFEGRYELGASIDVDSESLVLTLFDKANYGDTLAADENDSDSTDEVSFSIGDSDGTIDVGGNLITFDAELSSDKSAYALGENVTITIEDPDANSVQSAADQIDLELAASSGTAVIAATEMGLNTGIFTATFQIENDGRIAGTELVLDEDDVLTITYIDDKPADYETRLDNGQDPEKEFTLQISMLAGTSGIPSATLSSPAVRGIGEDIPLVVGSQFALSTTIQNDGTAEQPFVALIEVRDSTGITVYLAWQSGVLEAAGSKMIEVSWTPEVSGEYEVRTFAVSSLTNAIVLSEVATTNIDIS